MRDRGGENREVTAMGARGGFLTTYERAWRKVRWEGQYCSEDGRLTKSADCDEILQDERGDCDGL